MNKIQSSLGYGLLGVFFLLSLNGAEAMCLFDPECRDNPSDARSLDKSDGLMNPYTGSEALRHEQELGEGVCVKINGQASAACPGNSESEYGSPYSNKFWSNPYAADAPSVVDGRGNYEGTLRRNPFAPDSLPYGRYGTPYSLDNFNDPDGVGNPYTYLGEEFYVFPSDSEVRHLTHEPRTDSISRVPVFVRPQGTR